MSYNVENDALRELQTMESIKPDVALLPRGKPKVRNRGDIVETSISRPSSINTNNSSTLFHNK